MKKQSGFTLVEIMVTAVIGLFLMASLMNLFITTNKSVALSDALSQNQESGRFAMEYLTRYIRQAGYSTSGSVYAPAILSNKSTRANLSIPDAISANNPANAYGDRIAIPYVTDGTEIYRSCSGATFPDEGQHLANVFWVSNDPDTEFELRCRTYNYDGDTGGAWLDGAAVSIVNNVQSMEFQIGISNTASDRTTSRYINLDTLDNDPALSLNQVRSYRIALLTTSQDELDANKVKTNSEERQYSILDGPVLTIDDGNLRQVFSNTIELPNMIETSIFNN